jgi:hypothetical protein
MALKRLGLLVAAALIATPLIAAAPAHAGAAALYGCRSWTTGANAAYATCQGSGGQFRAVAYCRTVAGGTKVRFDAWRRPPTTSAAQCDVSEHVYDSAVQTTS